MSGWANSDDFRTSTSSPALSPWPECAGSSATLEPWSSRSAEPKKTRCGVCGTAHRGFYDQRPRRVPTSPAATVESISSSQCAGSIALGAVA